MNRSDHIAVFDWGTTHLRVHVVAAGGKILRTLHHESGIRQSNITDVPARFKRAIHELEAAFGPMPAVLVGMVGSNFGWHEVAMQAAPVAGENLARHLFAIDTLAGQQAMIVPGVTGPSIVGAPDMMRGEETQIFGVLEPQGTDNFCLPGTHTKWVRCTAGQITGITTAMTGEIFDLMQTQSVLQSALGGASASIDLAAFDDGLALSCEGLGALQLAFSIRARSLASDGWSSDAAKSHLSGLMIGSEVASMAPYLGSRLVIVGDPTLTRLYGRACQRHGIASRRVDGNEAVASGARWLYELQNETL